MKRVKFVLGMVVAAVVVAAVLVGVLAHPRTAHAGGTGAITFVPCGPWSNRPSPNPGAYNDQLFGVAAVSASDAWAVGDEGPGAGRPNFTLAEHWNGLNWSTVASPNESTEQNILQSVAAIASSDVWAVGYYYDNTTNEDITLAEHWNGAGWSIIPTPNPEAESQLFGVSATASNDVWAVGNSYNPSSYAWSALIEHWDGTSWSVVASPSPTGAYQVLYGVAAISASDAWAVASPTSTVPIIEHWDGNSWSIVSDAPATINGHLQGISAAGANSVWAVGYQFISSSQPQAALAEYWNGTSWTLMPNFTDGSNNVNLNSVVALPGTQQAVAVGKEYVGGGAEQPLMLQWDGSSWSKMPITSPNSLGSTLNAVAVIPAYSLWAVGSYAPTTTILRRATTRLRLGTHPGGFTPPGGPNAGIPQQRTLTTQEKGGPAAARCAM